MIHELYSIMQYDKYYNCFFVVAVLLVGIVVFGVVNMQFYAQLYYTLNLRFRCLYFNNINFQTLKDVRKGVRFSTAI